MNMPSIYVVRNLRENSYYHVCNQGVENKNIFLDKRDYETFLYYLFIYTAAPSEIQKKYPSLPARLIAKNFYGDIYLVAYCLMPNHFHFLLKQNSYQSMSKLIKQIVNAYITYFNKKYKHPGTIFAGRYKSIRIENENLLLQMTRFIHLNPVISGISIDPKDYLWSSYINRSLTNGLINRFGNFEEWEKFHLNREDYERNFDKISRLVIDI